METYKLNNKSSIFQVVTLLFCYVQGRAGRELIVCPEWVAQGHERAPRHSPLSLSLPHSFEGEQPGRTNAGRGRGWTAVGRSGARRPGRTLNRAP